MPTTFFDDGNVQPQCKTSTTHTQRKRCFGGLEIFSQRAPSIATLASKRELFAFSRPRQSSIKFFIHHSKKPGIIVPFRFTFLRIWQAGRTPQSIFASGVVPPFGRGEHFSSSTVESRRSGPTFLSLCLRLRKCDLVCLLDGGLDDLLLLGGEGGCELSVKLRLGL